MIATLIDDVSPQRNLPTLSAKLLLSPHFPNNLGWYDSYKYRVWMEPDYRVSSTQHIASWPSSPCISAHLLSVHVFVSQSPLLVRTRALLD